MHIPTSEKTCIKKGMYVFMQKLGPEASDIHVLEALEKASKQKQQVLDRARAPEASRLVRNPMDKTYLGTDI